MPKETFFKLPIEKKERIDIALKKEFAQNVFEAATVANIVKDADIPRGSFYTYFEDLHDAYFYIMESMDKKRKLYLYENHRETGVLIDDIINTMRLDSKFAKEVQYAHQIPRNLMKSNDERVKAYRIAFSEQEMVKMKSGIALMQARGIIRADVDVDMLTLIIEQVQPRLIKEFVENESFEFWEKRIRSLLDILISGIK